MGRNETRVEDHGTLADSELDIAIGGSLTSFLATVGGDMEAAWTPRTYAVQSDLSGGVTGARAGLYERRR